MASTKAYIHALKDKDSNDVYPVTVADAVYVQKSDGYTVTQTVLSKKLEEMEENFTAGCNTIITALKDLGVTPDATTPDGIAAAIKKLYEDRYAAGQDSVTVTCTMDGRKATATTSTGKTATAEAPLGNGDGNLTFVLTPEGKTTVYKDMAEGYYYAGTIMADGSEAFEACKTALNGSVTVSSGLSATKEGNNRARLSVDFGGTATMENGVLTLTCTASGKAKADSWKDDDWANTVTAEGSHTKTGTKSFI